MTTQERIENLAVAVAQKHADTNKVANSLLSAIFALNDHRGKDAIQSLEAALTK